MGEFRIRVVPALEQGQTCWSEGTAQTQRNLGGPRRLQVFRRTRELALFDLGIDSKLRGVVTLLIRVRGEAISAARTGSGGDAGHGLPLRHGVEVMKMGGKGGVTGTGPDEVIADGGEDGDEPLQASRRSEASCIARSRRRSGR